MTIAQKLEQKGLERELKKGRLIPVALLQRQSGRTIRSVPAHLRD